MVDLLVKELTMMNSKHNYRVAYLGPRFELSSDLHRRLARSPQHPVLSGPHQFGAEDLAPYEFCLDKLPRRLTGKSGPYVFEKHVVYYRPFEGSNPSLADEPLRFDSAFESGNLDMAVRVSSTEYDLFMRVDSNTLGHCNWYYFSVTASVAGTYRFNICNFFRPKNLYTKGKKPYTCGPHSGWQQAGTFLSYGPEPLRYQFLYKKLSSIPNFSRLSFEYCFQKD